MDINWKYKNNRYRPVLKKKRKREKEECAEESFEGEPLIPIVNNMNLNPSETICKVDNHIYLYDDITTDSNLKFVKFLREVDSNQQIKFQRGEITEPTIHIHINSNGGSLTDGFSMASTILSCKSNTISYCEGMVASAASLIMVVCNQRKIQRFCYVLIHQLSSNFWGTYQNFLDEQENLDNMMRKLTNLYTEFTSLPEKKIQKILKRDLFLDAETCIKYGLADDTC